MPKHVNGCQFKEQICDNDFKENCLPFWNMALLHFRTLSDFMFLEILTAFGTNGISDQIPVSKQNIFSTDVCKLQNYPLQSSHRIEPFHIVICSFEEWIKFFY